MVTLLNDPYGAAINSSIAGAIGSAQAAAPGMQQSAALARAESLTNAGYLGVAMGAITSALGAYYAADAQKYQLKAQASALDFQKEIAKRNASMAEQQAESLLAAGNKEIGRYTAAAGQAAAQERNRLGARGIQAGVGSASEVAASNDLAKQVDVLTMRSNTLRQAAAARTQAGNYQAQATAYGASAANARTSAGSISTWIGPTASLLGSAGMLGIEWARTQDYRRRRN